jgi:hypothetical protein
VAFVIQTNYPATFLLSIASSFSFDPRDQLHQKYKFATSYYLTEGLRITSAVMIPVLISAYFGHLSMGTAFALGTMCVSLSTIQPFHHRQNGMNISIVLIFITAIITGFSVAYRGYWR